MIGVGTSSYLTPYLTRSEAADAGSTLRRCSSTRQRRLAQIDKVLGEIGQRLKPGSYNDTRFVGTYTQAREDAVRARAVIERLTSPGSTYRDQANEIGAQKVPQDHKVLDLVGVLRALRKDLDDGYTRTIEELIHADVFADFLEMASELVDKNYKDPAAVIAGSTLEEHLRSLAGRSGVAVESEDGKPRKADTLNADLVKAGVYNKLEAKGRDSLARPT